MDIQQANLLPAFRSPDPLNHLWIDPGISCIAPTCPVTALCNADGDNAFTFARAGCNGQWRFHQRLDQQAGNRAFTSSSIS